MVKNPKVKHACENMNEKGMMITKRNVQGTNKYVMVKQQYKNPFIFLVYFPRHDVV